VKGEVNQRTLENKAPKRKEENHEQLKPREVTLNKKKKNLLSQEQGVLVRGLKGQPPYKKVALDNHQELRRQRHCKKELRERNNYPTPF